MAVLGQGFLYENQLEPVAELDGSGTLVSRFVYCGCGAGNIPQYMVKGGVTYRIIAGCHCWTSQQCRLTLRR